MLESLDKVPWTELGSEETPELIRRLVSDDESGQSEALSELFDSLAHQGTIYRASLAAVPFLLESLQTVTGSNRETLLSLIATIGSSPDCDKVDPEELRKAVAGGVETYLEILNSSTARDRDAVTVLLSLCTERAQKLIPILRLRVKMETDEAAKAGVLLALALLGRHESLDDLTNAFRAHDGLVRLAAALGAHRVAPETLSIDVRSYLLRAYAGVFHAEDLWEKLSWSFHSELVPGPTDVFGDSGEEERESSRMALLGSLPSSDAQTAIETLETLVWMDFGFSKEPISASSLMPVEIETLTALSQCSHDWQASEALRSALRQHGLPQTPAGIRTLLESSS